jgi:hypothetical protein
MHDTSGFLNLMFLDLILVNFLYSLFRIQLKTAAVSTFHPNAIFYWWLTVCPTNFKSLISATDFRAIFPICSSLAYSKREEYCNCINVAFV